ncbi:MAG: hypothetical protein KGZ59_09930 [Chitinophagaceae bacterium]|nr:hypothetical protein [Chitinophagaceae bacterium]
MKYLKFIFLIIFSNCIQEIPAQEEREPFIGKWKMVDRDISLVELIRGEKTIVEISKQEEGYKLLSYTTLKNNNTIRSTTGKMYLDKITDFEYKGKLILIDKNEEYKVFLKVKKQGNKIKFYIKYLFLRVKTVLKKVE